MKTAIPINKKLFDIYLLFTREPFVRYYTKELEFYSNGNGGLLGLISLDLIDNDYYGCILSRDKSKQYRAERIIDSLATIDEARIWIDEMMSNNSIAFHDNTHEYFDLFKVLNKAQQHPHFELLKSSIQLSSAKEVIKEVSYHYKDIDGNFIDQFQSINGLDSRVWELYLFCFFREQFFSFKRNYNAPDYMIEKFNKEIAIEAVIVSRRTNIEKELSELDLCKIPDQLANETPLLFANALFDKMKKKYWKKEHVKNIPFVIAIADFHDTMSMTWSYSALLEYLYGYKYEQSFDDNGTLLVTPIKVGNYTKPNGTEIPSGFFFQPHSENVSAVLFSSCGTLSKFNRMGKQAGLGSDIPTLIRMGYFYNHKPNADKANFINYHVNEFSNETWSEGVIIFHNPNALIPLEPSYFDDRVAQTFFDNKKLLSFMPEVFPYNSYTQNWIPKSKE